MAEFRIDVIVDPSRARQGTREVERSLDHVGQRADRTRQFIQRAFAFVGAGALVQQLGSLADSFTNLQNKIRLSTSNTEELAAVTDRLFEISNRTNTSVEATTQIFTRTSNAVKALGLSQKEVIEFTDQLSQAVAISGSSALEANAALFQFSQGLAKGKLDGEELRSVLEQLPIVADIIADRLGVARTELTALGAQGKITPQIIIDAFANADRELGQKFSKRVITLGQSFTNLRNNLIRFVGELDRSLGVTSKLGTGVRFLSENLDILARVAAVAGLALSVKFARVGVGAATTAVRALTVAIAANPIGLLVVAVTTAVSALIVFSDQIRLSGDGLGTLRDLAIAVFEQIAQALGPLVDFFGEAFDSLADLFDSVFGDINISITGVLTTVADVVDGIIGGFKGAVTAVFVAFDILTTKIKNLFITAFNRVLREATDFVNSLIDKVNLVPGLFGKTLIEPLKAFQIEAAKTARLTGEDIGLALAEGIESQTVAQDAINKILSRAEELAQERRAREATQRDSIAAATRALENVPEPEAATGADPLENLQKIEDQAKKTSETMEAGFRTGLIRIRKEFGTAGQLIEDSLVRAFGNAEGALVKFIETGKFNFSDFTNSVISDLTRIAVRQAITSGIANIAGGFAALASSESTGGGILPQLANGGSFQIGGRGGVDRNVLSVNNRPVARVSKGENVTVSPTGGGERPVQINFNISTPDADSFQRSQDQILARAASTMNRANRRNN